MLQADPFTLMENRSNEDLLDVTKSWVLRVTLEDVVKRDRTMNADVEPSTIPPVIDLLDGRAVKVVVV